MWKDLHFASPSESKVNSVTNYSTMIIVKANFIVIWFRAVVQSKKELSCHLLNTKHVIFEHSIHQLKLYDFNECLAAHCHLIATKVSYPITEMTQIHKTHVEPSLIVIVERNFVVFSQAVHLIIKNVLDQIIKLPLGS